MPEFRVKWEIDLEADNAQEAARFALDIQRDPAGSATVFDVARQGVKTVQVDLREYGRMTNAKPVLRRLAADVVLVPGALDAEAVAMACAMRANYIETGDVTLSADDLAERWEHDCLRTRDPRAPKTITAEQKALVKILLRLEQELRPYT